MNEITKSVPTLFDGDTITFSSLSPTTPEEKISLFNLINNPTKRLSEMVNITINVTDIYCEMVEMVDDSTGELVSAPRIVLIDADGCSYQCVSKGIFSAIRKLVSPSMFGLPTWNPPVAMQVKTITKDKKSILTLNLA